MWKWSEEEAPNIYQQAAPVLAISAGWGLAAVLAHYSQSPVFLRHLGRAAVGCLCAMAGAGVVLQVGDLRLGLH